MSLDLVHIPAVLYPTTRSDDLNFDWLDRHTMDRVSCKHINKTTSREVPREQIVCGHVYGRDRYMVLIGEDIRAANLASTQMVDLLTFTGAVEVPPLHFDMPCFPAPDRRGEKVYALLREASTRLQRTDTTSAALHTKQHLAALIPIGPVLAPHTLRWSDETCDWSEFDLPEEGAKAAKLTVKEIDMAEKLVDDMSGRQDPAEYHDMLRNDIPRLVDRKTYEDHAEFVEPVETETVVPRSGNIIDLTDLLRQSLAKRGKSKGESAKEAEEEPAPHKRTPRKAVTKATRKTAIRKRA